MPKKRSNSDDAETRAERLRESTDRPAGLVRNIHFTFLLFSTYSGITIGSTTDKQTLKVSLVTLPILNVQLSIVAFYAAISWLFLLCHFNLLSRKLYLFDAAVAEIPDKVVQNEQRIRLFPFPFSQMLAGAQLKGAILLKASLKGAYPVSTDFKGACLQAAELLIRHGCSPSVLTA